MYDEVNLAGLPLGVMFDSEDSLRSIVSSVCVDIGRCTVFLTMGGQHIYFMQESKGHSRASKLFAFGTRGQ